MTVRTYYGDERVTVEGPDGSRLPGTVSGVAGGRVVVALDEPHIMYPVIGPEGTGVPGHIAQVLERDLEFFASGSDSSAPSFSPEQLAYLRRAYGDIVTDVADAEERNAAASQADTTFDANEDDEDIEADAKAAAAGAAKASGAGLSQDELAKAKNAAEA